MGQPPTGTVTFLFTDIEGSTRLWEERPDDMRALVAEHDARFRAAVEENRGYVVKTTGDGLHAAFGRAADAVAAAEAAQATIADLSEIRARIGINTGEAQERDGDYFGPAVNRTSRLTAAGHGGQVLLSAVTAELVPDLVVRDLGEHRLRDLSGPMRIFQLGADEFPPLRTLDELPGNLPMQRTSFIGRADEVKELAAVIENERLLTLTGVGGVGKSRLALQVAAEVAPLFRGGAWFASLAALEEGALVAATILESIGVPERRDEAAIDTLCAWANGREALVVIDNCEHLLNAVAEVVDRMVDTATGAAVLATSQAPLGVRGERAWAVNPLARPNGPAHDSVELFVDRARLARADFELTAENEAAVVEICERLDHIPLAIELAAARARGMTPADIARRLDQRFRLLTSNDRLAPGRHRTLDAAVRWSYELLDDTQQRVFDRLSVFAGPFTIDAAEAIVVGGVVDDWEVLDALLALVDKSLVVADEETAATRYRLLETMRQFGDANLSDVNISDTGTHERYRDRHADYYADYVLSRRAQLQGAGDQAALDDIERELENIRVALRHAADDHGSARFEALYGALSTLWLGRSRGSEGRSWATEIAQRSDIEPAARIVALGWAASVSHNSDLASGAEFARAAIDLSTSTGAAPALMAISVLSLDALMQGDNGEAIACCERARALAVDEPDLFIRASALINCYAVLATCGSFDHLDEIFREMTALSEALDNEYLRAGTANSMAPIIHLTEPANAGEYLRRGYELNVAIGNVGAAHATMMYLALHELRAGNATGAAEAAQRSLQLSTDFGSAYIAQVINVTIAIVKRYSAPDAIVLLGALRTHRERKHQAGTLIEIDSEARYESSLRRAVGKEFDARYAQGLALDEPAMITFAFAQLAAISDR
jgi:predicted ATPase